MQVRETMHHRRNVGEDGQRVKSASLIRRFVHKVQKKYVKLVLFLLCMASIVELAILAVYIYVEQFVVPWDSETSPVHYQQGIGFFIALSVLCWLVSLEWVVLLIGEQYRVSYVLSLPTLINVLTCFPMVIISIGAMFDESWHEVWVPLYLRIWWLYNHLLLLLDYPQLAFLFSELTRETLRHVLFLVSTMITCIGTFQAVESFSADVIHLFESTYFIVVTFGTIGYGDIHPTTAFSRMVTIGIIVVAVYQFPLFFSKLAELAKERPKYTTFSSRSGAEHHVIVAGSLADRDVAFFLNEFFSGTRKFIRLKMVLLSTVEFSQETRLLVTSPGYSQRVTLVIGDASSRADLDRCDAGFADAIFHVNNSNQPSSLADYDIVMKAIAVHQYDANLPQHVMLRRERNSKFICNVVSSIMEKERLQYTLLGLGCVLPGAIPLVVNFIRTYDPDESVERCRDWREQNEWGMGMEVYTFPIPDELVQKNFPFTWYTYAYFKYNIVIIGTVDDEDQIVLNPVDTPMEGKKLQLVAIAPDKYVIERSTKAIVRRPPKIKDMPGFTQVNPWATTGSSIGDFASAEFNETSSFAASPRAMRDMTRSVLFTVEDQRDQSSGRPTPDPTGTTPVSERTASPEIPEVLRDTTKPSVVLTAAEAAIQLKSLKNHIVLVDLVSARVAPDLSPEALHEGAHFQGTDLFNIMRPIKLHNPDTDIVLLTRDDLPNYFLKLWAQTGCRPVIVVKGCGLNMEELRSTQIDAAKSAVIFSTGEGIDENGDAMTLLVSFSIEEIVKECGRSIPVVVSVDHIESLSLFPPYYSDDAWTAEAEGNFALEPNMILGRAICSSMLDPALYQTYFSPHLLNAVDALIYGNGRSAPIKSMVLPADCETYADVIAHCVSRKVVPIGLHREIDDAANEELHQQRFMFSAPPSDVQVVPSDVVYYIQ